ncbi:unnamed protein product [Rhizoctonia solani]|uniref:Major facilitator superfamily (MFS) profile domain-containing protein n=1 Tax=Rhizoctonia solani TaxID=456999 RepID=A0A8H2X892_9AGAM|nr:unnamed protein product [Rhizoctonia solani]
MKSLANFFRNDEAANSPPEIFNFRIYFLGLTSALGGATFGWDTGFIGGAVGLDGFKARFKISADTSDITANVVATLQAGCFFGSLAAAPLSIAFGRRIAMHVFLLLFQIGTVLQLLPGGSLALMYAGRVLTGGGVGAISVLNPMYISECAPRAIRGRMTSTVNLVIVSALTIAFFVNLIAANHLTGDVQWRVPFALPMIPAGLMQIGMLFQPESPRWLVSKDRDEEAHTVLVQIRKLPPTHPYIMEELQHIRTQLDAERAATAGTSTLGLFKEIVTHVPSRRVFAVGCFLQFAQQLTGTNSINYYSPLIFKLIGFTGGTTALLATGVYGIVKVVTTLFYVVFLIDQIGRRRPLIVGATIQALCLLVLFFISHFDPLLQTPTGGGVTSSGYASAVMIYVYAFGWSFGFSVAPWVLAAEIFPTRIRAVSFSAVIALQWGLNFMITRVTPLMITAMGIQYVFLFFALCTFSKFCPCALQRYSTNSVLATTGIVYFIIPETKGFPLEAMDALFSFGWIHTKDLRPRALAVHKSENEAAAAEAAREDSLAEDQKSKLDEQRIARS